MRHPHSRELTAGFTGAVAGTYLTSARLAAAGCTWDTYCNGEPLHARLAILVLHCMPLCVCLAALVRTAGGCDSAAGGTSVPDEWTPDTEPSASAGPPGSEETPSPSPADVPVVQI